MDLYTAIKIIQPLIPAYSAVSWIIFILLSLKECKNQKEIKIKNTLILSYLASAVATISISIYSYYPEKYFYISSLAYLSFLLIHVYYYKLIFLLSTVENKTKFSAWHYFLPILLCGCFFVYSMITPIEVQNALATMRGRAMENYPFYSIQFLSQSGISLLFSIAYTVLTINRLWHYYGSIEKRKDVIRRPRGWVILLVFCKLTILLTATIIYILPLEEIASSSVSLIYILFIVTQHIILGYNILRRNFMLYIPDSAIDENSERQQTNKIQEETVEKTKRKRNNILRRKSRILENGVFVVEKLTKKNVDDYIKKEKPFLDPQLKITDLLEPLNTNRTQLSGFINKTYGLNFNRFINSLRLEELKRLVKKAENSEKGAIELAEKAGFANYRKYLRTIHIENELNKTKQIEKQSESIKKAEDE